MSGTFRKGHNTTRSSRGTSTYNVDEAVGEADQGDHTVTTTSPIYDWTPEELRGIPAVGRNCAGAIRDTSPHSAIR